MAKLFTELIHTGSKISLQDEVSAWCTVVVRWSKVGLIIVKWL